MNLKDIMAVSGLPGLFKMVTSRNNGLLVANIDTGKTKFCSVRKHQFTPLETVAIYTHSDTTELKEIFGTMLSALSENPPVSVKASAEEIIAYFSMILPDYDPDRVYVSDMKKVIKWFNFLNDRNMLTEDASEEEE